MLRSESKEPAGIGRQRSRVRLHRQSSFPDIPIDDLEPAEGDDLGRIVLDEAPDRVGFGSHGHERSAMQPRIPGEASRLP